MLSGTRVNAEILLLEDRIGRVAKGFVADLIVVDGDPLRDLSLLGDPEGRHIPLVMQSGQIVKRSGALAPGH